MGVGSRKQKEAKEGGGGGTGRRSAQELGTEGDGCVSRGTSGPVGHASCGWSALL